MNMTVELPLWLITLFSTLFGGSMGLIVKWLYDGTLSKENRSAIREHERRLKNHDRDIDSLREDISDIKKTGVETLGVVNNTNDRFADLNNHFVELSRRFNNFLENQGGK